MELVEKFLQDFESLSEENKKEVINFIAFLKDKSEKELEDSKEEDFYENRITLE